VEKKREESRSVVEKEKKKKGGGNGPEGEKQVGGELLSCGFDKGGSRNRTKNLNEHSPKNHGLNFNMRERKKTSKSSKGRSTRKITERKHVKSSCIGTEKG